MASRKPSLVFHKCRKAAVSDAITATTATTGAEMPPKAAPSLPNSPVPPCTAILSLLKPFASCTKPFIAVPIFDIAVPKITRKGPSAATNRPIFNTICLVPSSMPFSLSTNSCIFETIFRIVGISISPKEMASSWSWLFRMVSCPIRLSCMVAAIFSAMPSQLAIAPLNFSISAGAAFIKARKPLIAFLPTRVSAALAFSDSVSPPKATRQSARISDKLRMEPSAFVVAISTFPID